MASAGHSDDDDDDDDAATSSRGAIMQTPPAAQSLASLTALANSPPTRRPDLQQSFERKGLLLWIVRVPEKKDIIFTPIHPAKTSQTATKADIEACLYYLHFSQTGPGHGGEHGSWATLIRRYPAENKQWDVASIFPCSSPSAAGAGAEMRIEMLSEGYRLFCRRTSPSSSRPLAPPASPAPLAPPASPASPAPPPAQHAYSTTHPIPRKPAGGVEEGGVVRKPQQQHDVGREPLTRVLHVEGESSGTGSRVGGSGVLHAAKRVTAGAITKATALAAGGRRRAVFDGLWADEDSGASCGRCVFKDEGTGKYVKCKYYPSDPDEKSILLSVIEFNNDNKRYSLSAAHHGDQKGATGGMVLKAKLGMLIVHGPGQEMLDLIVAANIARLFRVWWGTN